MWSETLGSSFDLSSAEDTMGFALQGVGGKWDLNVTSSVIKFYTIPILPQRPQEFLIA